MSTLVVVGVRRAADADSFFFFLFPSSSSILIHNEHALFLSYPAHTEGDIPVAGHQAFIINA